MENKKFRELSFLEHVKELRRRLIISAAGILIGAIIAFIFYPHIVDFLYQPYSQIPTPNARKLFIMSLFDGFLVKIKISVITGIIITAPLHIYNILKFIIPGLHKKEIKIIVLVLISGCILAILSVYYGYCYIIPFSIKFLTGSEFIPDKIGILLNFKSNILYIVQFIFVCIITFQLPIVLMLLLAMHIVSRKNLISWSRYVVIIIFIFSAIITPPDFISQLAVAIPLLILYFAAIFIAKIFHIGEK